jgi:hypothetical protein
MFNTYNNNNEDHQRLRLVQVDVWVDARTKLTSSELEKAVAEDIIDSVRGYAYTILVVDAQAESNVSELVADYISEGIGQLEDYINGGAK